MRYEKDPQTEYQRYVRTPKFGTSLSDSWSSAINFLIFSISMYFFNMKFALSSTGASQFFFVVNANSESYEKNNKLIYIFILHMAY
jgi:hypothetical protein